MEHCDYFVDLVFNYDSQRKMFAEWELLDGIEFLDAARTGFLGRVFWFFPGVFSDTREWGWYWLYRRVGRG